MVQVKIQEMKPGKSPGPDGWHPVFLKNVADLISQPLSILFQKSLIKSIVPAQWLKACITAIHKKGAKNLFENYRPVSITSIVCKNKDKVVGHMENNQFIFKQQLGFVTLKNCMTNLLLCMEDWTNYIEDGHPIDIIYTDFAKAFVRVTHQKFGNRWVDLQLDKSIFKRENPTSSSRSGVFHLHTSKNRYTSRIGFGPILFVIFIKCPTL